MNGPEHYREAERLLDVFKQVHIDAEAMPDTTVEQFEKRAMAVSAARALLDKAQVHATLAQVAAIANHQSGESSTSLAETPGEHWQYDGPDWPEVLR